MPQHLIAYLTVALLRRASALARRWHHDRDTGMETVDKIIWAAVVLVVASAAGAVFRQKILDFINNLTITLGW